MPALVFIWKLYESHLYIFKHLRDMVKFDVAGVADCVVLLLFADEPFGRTLHRFLSPLTDLYKTGVVFSSTAAIRTIPPHLAPSPAFGLRIR